MRIMKKYSRIVLCFILAFMIYPFSGAVEAASSDYVSVSRSVNPSSILMDGEAEVTLNIQGTPPVNVTKPNDVILILDKSGSMAPEFGLNKGEDKMQNAKNAAKGFIDLMDFSKHRVGVVDFSSVDITGRSPLTTDAEAAKAYIDTIQAYGSTATGDAIDVAIQELSAVRSEAQPVIVLLTDGGATIPSNDAFGYALEKAKEAKEAGIVFYTIALLSPTEDPETSGPNILLKNMATTSSHHHFVLGSVGLSDIYAQIVEEIGVASAYDVVVTDEVAPNFEIVPDSYLDNIPKPTVEGNKLTWNFKELKNDNLTFTYKIRPVSGLTAGKYATSTSSSSIEYKDYAGALKTKSIPVGSITLNEYPPIITEITPDAGHPKGGEQVVIKGENFKAGATVVFDSTTVTSPQIISDQEIAVTVPAHAQGTVAVKVTNPDKQFATTSYTYITDPIVTKLSPNNGPLEGGNIVEVQGSYFTKGVQVLFNGKAARTDVARSDYIRVYVPAGDAPGVVDVMVKNPDGSQLTLTGAYTYNEPVVPKLKITKVSPNTGSKNGGTTVYIDGQLIDPNAQVFFGDVNTPINTYYSSSRINVLAPPSVEEGPVDIRIVNPDLIEAIAKDAYTYTASVTAPDLTFTNISTNTAQVETVVSAYINGGGFQEGIKVYFGSEEATVINYYGLNRLMINTPKYMVAEVTSIRLVNPDGSELLVPNVFEFTAKPADPLPTITNITPTTSWISGGATGYLNGSGFKPGVKLYIGANEATIITLYNANRMYIRIPASVAGGVVDVKVKNPNGDEAILAGGFEYLVPPPELVTITSVTPNSGLVKGGEVVTLEGENFKSGATVLFGNNVATISRVYSSSRAAVIAPAASSAGSVDIKWTNFDGQSYTVANGYTYGEATPIISKLSVRNGAMAGGTTVYIDGQNFEPNMTVTINGVDVPITTYYRSERFMIKTPSSAVSGDVPLVITLMNGRTASTVFTYDAPPPVLPPVITKMNVTSGSTSGGTTIYIDGSGFQDGLTVLFGDNAGTVTTYYNQRRLMIKTPAGNPGTVTVRIINPDGQESNTFEYTYK